MNAAQTCTVGVQHTSHNSPKEANIYMGDRFMHSASSPLLRPHKWFLIVIACGYALAVTATGTDGGKDSATDDASFGDRSALFPNTLRTSDTGPRRVLTNDEESIAAFDETDQLYSYADVSALFAHRRKLAAESNNTLEPIIDALNRRLIGSNCIMVGNGIVPPFFKCTGCVLEQAMGCVDDLRRNLSGSVPYDCLLDVVAEKYSDACCPSYTFLRKQTLLEYSTSAFPQTLACIEAVGCMMSQVYTDVIDMCLHSCSAVYPTIDGHAVCTGKIASAPRSMRWPWLAVAVSIAVLLVSTAG